MGRGTPPLLRRRVLRARSRPALTRRAEVGGAGERGGRSVERGRSVNGARPEDGLTLRFPRVASTTQPPQVVGLVLAPFHIQETEAHMSAV